MGRNGIVAFWLLVFLLVGHGAQAQLSQPLSPTASNGLIVKFKSTTTRSSRDHLLSTAGLRSVDTYSLVPGLVFARPVAGQKTVNSLAALVDNPNIEYIEPDYLLTIARTPNDPLYNNTYSLNNVGQTGGVANADIDAPEAWDITTGKNIVIAIIDTGIEANHADLSANLWVNPGEVPGNNIDDDNNGFIDDVNGYDFTNNTGAAIDELGHGTHVAGIVGAVANNGVGGVGVNWLARIMPLRFMNAQGIGATSNAIRAVNYAVAMGARVINASWGGGSFSQAMYDTLAAANVAGHVFVTAAGNESNDVDSKLHYPSGYDLPNIISVGSTTAKDEFATFSNYGVITIDLAAPGDRIESTYKGGGYQILSGTSMSTPYVAGAISLLLSVAPNLSVADIRSAILNTVDVLPALKTRVATSGRLNILRALKSVNSNLHLTPISARLGLNKTLQFNVTGGVGPYSWSVTNSAVGSIGAGDGLFVATQAGVTRINVKDSMGGSAPSGEVFVDQLTITPQTAVLQPGASLNLVVTGGVAPYRFQSSAPAVASIDTFNSVLTALNSGSVIVTATDQNNIEARTGKIDVISVSPLTISPLSLTLPPGASQLFTASGGLPPYAWTSQYPNIASVQVDTGSLTALTVGSTQLMLRDALGSVAVTGTIEVATLRVQLAAGAKNSLVAGTTLTLKAVGGSPPYQWRVSDSSVASIDQNGTLFAIAQGTVRATVVDGAGNTAQSDIVTVISSGPLTLPQIPRVMAPGMTTRLFASGGVPPYHWSVSNNSVLSWNDATGMLTATGVGSAEALVTDFAGASRGTGLIEVRQVAITPNGGNYLVGQAVGVIASGGRGPYQWSLNNTSIASIDLSGNLRANAPGSLTVTATDVDSMKATSSTFTFLPGTLTLNSIQIKPSSTTMSARGLGMTFLVSGGTAPYTFSLSNEAVGFINPLSGVFTPRVTTSGDTTVIVRDASGQTAESGVVAVR